MTKPASRLPTIDDNVTYHLDGKDGFVRMPFKPGPTLPVKDGQVVTTLPAKPMS